MAQKGGEMTILWWVGVSVVLAVMALLFCYVISFILYCVDGQYMDEVEEDYEKNVRG